MIFLNSLYFGDQHRPLSGHNTHVVWEKQVVGTVLFCIRFARPPSFARADYSRADMSDSPPPDAGAKPAAASSAEDLIPIVYAELRRLAAAKLAHELGGQTLQPTALVHEAWLRLGGDRQPQWANRAHFFGAAAECMRRILIDRARSKRAIRHGGDLARVNLDGTGFDVPAATDEALDLELVSEALDALAVVDARKAQLVKHKFFLGLTIEDAADLIGISHSTAHRDWAFARAWLFKEVKRLRG